MQSFIPDSVLKTRCCSALQASLSRSSDVSRVLLPRTTLGGPSGRHQSFSGPTLTTLQGMCCFCERASRAFASARDKGPSTDAFVLFTASTYWLVAKIKGNLCSGPGEEEWRGARYPSSSLMNCCPGLLSSGLIYDLGQIVIYT